MKKALSLLFIFLGSFLWIGWIETFGILTNVNEKVVSSARVIVYLQEDISGKDIQNLRNLFNTKDNIKIENFTSSIQALNKLKENISFSKQIDVIEEDFSLPASFELGFKTIDYKYIKNIAQQIKSYSGVQKVEVPEQVIKNTEMVIEKSRKIKLIFNIFIFLGGILLFYSSGYLVYLLKKKNINFGKNISVKRFDLIKPGIIYLIIASIVSCILSAAIIYFLASNLDMEFVLNYQEIGLVFGLIAIICIVSYMQIFNFYYEKK
ncbi:MAG: cell division protein FtsX [Elusimicrobiota bacterium]